MNRGLIVLVTGEVIEYNPLQDRYTVSSESDDLFYGDFGFTEDETFRMRISDVDYCIPKDKIAYIKVED